MVCELIFHMGGTLDSKLAEIFVRGIEQCIQVELPEREAAVALLESTELPKPSVAYAKVKKVPEIKRRIERSDRSYEVSMRAIIANDKIKAYSPSVFRVAWELAADFFCRALCLPRYSTVSELIKMKKWNKPLVEEMSASQHPYSFLFKQKSYLMNGEVITGIFVTIPQENLQGPNLRTANSWPEQRFGLFSSRGREYIKS